MSLPPLKSACNIFKRFFTFLLIPIIIFCTVLIQPDFSYAASGGRIGGGSFRAPTSPSIPRGGSYGGGYGGRGYGYRGGGMGLPFLLPIFGFGGGGLFGFLILMSITGVIVNTLRGAATYTTENKNQNYQTNTSSITLIQVQLGLLASAKDLQQDLRALAENADTNSSEGLQKILQETSLSLLRQPNLWVYANIESGKVPFNSAETTFNQLSIRERSKLSAEIVSNISGTKNNYKNENNSPGEADISNEYIAATILIASKKHLNLNEPLSNESLKNNLMKLGSIASDDLVALEVIWQPEGKGESISAQDLVINYPNLKHL